MGGGVSVGTGYGGEADAVSLAQVLARQGTLEPRRVSEIIYQLAGQLDEARLAGRSFGGIEPRLVKIVSAPGQRDTAYVPGYLLGDAAEMTPEQRAHKAQRALVTLAIQMLTGARLDLSRPAWDQVHGYGLPPTTASVLISALAERADVFASFVEFSEALARSLGVPLGDQPVPGQEVPPPSVARRAAAWAAARARAAARAGVAARVWAMAIAIVAVVVAIAVFAVTDPYHRPPGPHSTPALAGAPDWGGWPGAPVVSALNPAASVIVSSLDPWKVNVLVAVSSDGTRLIAVDSDGNATQVNLRSGAYSHLPSQSTGISPDLQGFVVAFSPDMAKLAVAGSAAVEAQSFGSGKSLGSLTVGQGSSVFEFSPDGKTLAIGDDDGAIHLLNLATGRSAVLRSRDAARLGGVTALAFSPDSRELAVGTYSSEVDLWNVVSGARTVTLPEPAGGGVAALAFGEKGALLAAGDDDGTVYLWSVTHRRLLGALAGSPATAGTNTDQVAFSPDGGLVAASFDDGTVGVWSAATGRRLAVLNDASTSPTDPVTFGLGGRVLVNLNSAGDLTQWSLGRSLIA
jgi:hypothetical protein